MEFDQLNKIRNVLRDVCVESVDSGVKSKLGPEGKARNAYIAKLRRTQPGAPAPDWISRAKLIPDICRHALKAVSDETGLGQAALASPAAVAYFCRADSGPWDTRALAVVDAVEQAFAAADGPKPGRAFECALAWLLGWRREMRWGQSDWLGCPPGPWSEFLVLVHDLIKELRQWAAEDALQIGAVLPNNGSNSVGRNARVPGLQEVWSDSDIPKQAAAVCRQLTRRDCSGCHCAATDWAKIATGTLAKPRAAALLDQIRGADARFREEREAKGEPIDAEAEANARRAAVELAIWQFLAGARLDTLRRIQAISHHLQDDEESPEDQEIEMPSKAEQPPAIQDDTVISAFEREQEKPGSLAAAATTNPQIAAELENLNVATAAMLKLIDDLKQTSLGGSFVKLDLESAVTVAILADNVGKATRNCLLHHFLGSWDGKLSLWKFLRQAVLGNFGNVIKASGLTSGMFFPFLESHARVGYEFVVVRICAQCTEAPDREKRSLIVTSTASCPSCHRDLGDLPETIYKMLIVADPGGAGGFSEVKVWKCKTCQPAYARGNRVYPAYRELAGDHPRCSVAASHQLSERPTSAWRYTGASMKSPGASTEADDQETLLRLVLERMIDRLEDSGAIEEWAGLAALEVLHEAAGRAAREKQPLRAVLDFSQPLGDPAAVLREIAGNIPGRTDVPNNERALSSAWTRAGGLIQGLWERVRVRQASTLT